MKQAIIEVFMYNLWAIWLSISLLYIVGLEITDVRVWVVLVPTILLNPHNPIREEKKKGLRNERNA